MNIMVFDVPAESGGALSVLQEVYNEYRSDLNNKYIFVVSKPELQETDNIKVLRFPWIKKSWFHRLFFDNFIAPRLIKRYKVDRVLSLQNITIPHTKVFQSVLVHNALPFAEYRFSLGEDKLLWIYQNVLSRRIFRSIETAEEVIVQTQWMKNRCVEELKLKDSKVVVKPPMMDIKVKRPFVRNKTNLATFFYPASGVIFKNHKIIVDACVKLKEEGFNDYKVIFTLQGNENKDIVNLYNKILANGLPVEFIGSITRDEVFAYYSKSVLLFPSFIETVGLPLIEAMHHDTPILVSDFSYSREILKGYDKVEFFASDDTGELSRLIKKTALLIQG